MTLHEKRLRLDYLLALVLVTTLLTGCANITNTPTGAVTSAPQQEVTIGVVGMFSGPFASYGEWVRNGAELGKEEAEKRWNVSIKLVYEDSGCDSPHLLSALSKLHSVDNVNLVTGFPCSPDVGAAWTNENNVLMVQGGDNLGKLGENWYSTRFSTQEAMSSLAEFAYNNRSARRTGIIYFQGIWGETSKNAYAERFKSLGGTIVEEEGVTGGSDFRTTLLKFKQAEADSVLMIYSNGADFVNQLADLDMNVTKLVDSQFESDQAVAIGGKNLEGIYYVRAKESASESAQSFQQAYETTHHKIPDIAASGTYDGVLVSVQAAVTCKSDTNVTCLRDAVQKTKDLPGASGALTFDTNVWSFVQGDFMIKTYHDGAFVPINTNSNGART